MTCAHRGSDSPTDIVVCVFYFYCVVQLDIGLGGGSREADQAGRPDPPSPSIRAEDIISPSTLPEDTRLPPVWKTRPRLPPIRKISPSLGNSTGKQEAGSFSQSVSTPVFTAKVYHLVILYYIVFQTNILNILNGSYPTMLVYVRRERPLARRVSMLGPLLQCVRALRQVLHGAGVQ